MVIAFLARSDVPTTHIHAFKLISWFSSVEVWPIAVLQRFLHFSKCGIGALSPHLRNARSAPAAMRFHTSTLENSIFPLSAGALERIFEFGRLSRFRSVRATARHALLAIFRVLKCGSVASSCAAMVSCIFKVWCRDSYSTLAKCKKSLCHCALPHFHTSISGFWQIALERIIELEELISPLDWTDAERL